MIHLKKNLFQSFVGAGSKPAPKRLFALILFGLFALSQSAFALDIPPSPKQYVADYANVLSDATEAQLNQTLDRFEKSDSTQIVAAIFSSLEGESLEDFTIRLAEAWKIGQKGKDNGVLFTVFIQDRKMRIDTGYGSEEFLTDLRAAEIIRNVIAPEFQQGNIDQGVLNGVNAMIATLRGEFKNVKKSKGSTSGKLVNIVFFIFIFFFVIPFIRAMRGKTIGVRHSGSRRYGSGFSSSRSSGGFSSGGFSGGGGSFGGGGASGGW
ncbi:MAG: TPM domain-containing protein [Deltaproteobacteria bacterium]|nr:TPM domain-containing protein [Deltaproteobacteria bacterium]